MKKYNLSFFKTLIGTLDIKTENERYKFICLLSSFNSIKKIEEEIIPTLNLYKINCQKKEIEWVNYTDGFIRLENKEIIFGQYVDENLATLDQFKDYLEEGEKITGSIPLEDFIQIIEQWLCFLKEKR